MKICPNCKISKNLDEYNFSKGKLSGYCKECNKIKCKEYTIKRKISEPNFMENERKRAIKRRQDNKDYRVGQMFHSIKKSAAKRNIEVTITRNFIKLLIDAQNWTCSKTGLPFDLTAGFGKMPFGPTVDRIDSKGIYEAGNIQIVCNIYNYAKNEFDDETVLEFATALLEKQK